MNINEWLRQAQHQLEAAGVGTARLDSLVLLEDTLHTDRARLLAHAEKELDQEQILMLQSLIDRRSNHEPLAYIRGKTEFYGHEFIVNHDVLEPRPESETMIEQLKHLAAIMSPNDHKELTIADVGTGSGALAISAQLLLPETNVIAVDIDPACLKIALQNIKQHNANVHLLQGDLLLPLVNNHIYPDVLLCNLPYVPDSFHINPAALQEPRKAIFGGKDGLDVYRKLFGQLTFMHPQRPHFILTEALPPQHTQLAAIAMESGYQLELTDDFIQVFRIG